MPRVTAQKVGLNETKTRKARKAKAENPEEDEGKGGRRRKKQKLSEDEEGDEDDASKKSRGRPRLDTKDETAADVGTYISLSFYFVGRYRHFLYFEDGNGSSPRETLQQWPVSVGFSCHISLWIMIISFVLCAFTQIMY